MIHIKRPGKIRFRRKAWLRRKIYAVENCIDPKKRSKLIDQLAKVPQQVTDKLVKHFHSKCWYCERILPRSELVIEHFRPKRRVTLVKAHSGYFWLAANSKNFRIACTNCNCRWTNPGGAVAGKGNYFPLMAEANRSWTKINNLLLENPVLLDPLVQSDTECLMFIGDGTCMPVSDDYVEVGRGFSSINIYNLNNPALIDERKDYWRILELYIKNGYVARFSDPSIWKETIGEMRDRSRDYGRYAGMVRSLIRKTNAQIGAVI